MKSNGNLRNLNLLSIPYRLLYRRRVHPKRRQALDKLQATSFEVPPSTWDSFRVFVEEA